MTERLSLDTNILVYAVDAQSGGRHDRAIEVVKAAAASDCVLTVQALAEFYHVVTRKSGLSRKEAATKIDELSSLFEIVAADVAALATAVGTARTGRLSVWDGLLLAAVEQAGCTLLLSEDMADGARYGSVTILNPFAGLNLPRRAAAALGLS